MSGNQLRCAPFSLVRGANNKDHLVLQYEKTRKDASPNAPEMAICVVNHGPSYVSARSSDRAGK